MVTLRLLEMLQLLIHRVVVVAVVVQLPPFQLKIHPGLQVQQLQQQVVFNLLVRVLLQQPLQVQS